MSGHSKWATIKHKKGATDAKRGKMFTKLIKEITVAARMGGGDVTSNPRLRTAVAAARGQAMPLDTITRAVKRGAGELDGESYDEVLYEGSGPGGTLFLVEGVTDNRNRTVAELRKIFEKNNGLLGTSGTAGWNFERRGLIVLDKSKVTEDQLMDLALGAGADDYSDEGDDWHVYTATDAMQTVADALEKAGLTPISAKMAYLPKVKKPLEGRDAEVALNLADVLDDHDDVQNVYADFDVSDEVMASLA